MVDLVNSNHEALCRNHGAENIYELVDKLSAENERLKDHNIASMVNELTEITTEYVGYQSLRQRISDCVNKYLKG